LKNIRFFNSNHLVKHSDPKLHCAECASITFELQKRDTKNDISTQQKSGDAVLCPVKTWAAIVHRISSYPGASPTDSVNIFHFSDGLKHLFTGSELLKRL
jgi:hypothetical protein